jgi:flagellar biosynthesis protein FliQ
MTESMIMTLGRDALMMALMLGLPVLAVCLVVGLVVSLFQAVTQINEMTLSFVPKLIGVGAVVLILGPWMLQQIVRFTVQLIDLIPTMVR